MPVSSGGGKSKVPPNLQPEVLKRAGEGIDYEAIVAWLKDAHGITSSPSAISRLVRRDAKRSAEVAKSELRRALRKVVGKKFGRLANLMARSVRDEERAIELFRLALGDSGATDAEDLDDKLKTMVKAPANIDFENARLALTEARKARDQQAKLLDLAYHYAGADTPDAPTAPNEDARTTLLTRMQTLIDRAAEKAAKSTEKAVH
jgi:EAL domain-containing protein (putative c-di-GMP-specific phosphodiesterase class I)